jgi:hypothetical protein
MRVAVVVPVIMRVIVMMMVVPMGHGAFASGQRI